MADKFGIILIIILFQRHRSTTTSLRTGPAIIIIIQQLKSHLHKALQYPPLNIYLIIMPKIVPNLFHLNFFFRKKSIP